MIKEILLVHMLNALSVIDINEITWVPADSNLLVAFHILHEGYRYQVMVVDGAYSVTSISLSDYSKASAVRTAISDHIKAYLSTQVVLQ